MTAEQLRAMLNYAPETGVFTRRIGGPGISAGDVAGSLDSNGYRRITLGYRSYYAHRLAWFYVHGDWPATSIDHLNLVRDDNRLANLREATKSENMRNCRKHSNNKSGFKGVCWDRGAGKWRAYIVVEYKQTHLGVFDTAEEAHAA